MSPKQIHPEIHNIGSPTDAARGKPIPMEKPSIGPDPNVHTIPGPVPPAPKKDGPMNPAKVSTGTTAEDNYMVVNKPKK